MAKFEWALQQMREGKKVRQKESSSGYFIHIDKSKRIVDPDGYRVFFDWETILAEDWELFTE